MDLLSIIATTLLLVQFVTELLCPAYLLLSVTAVASKFIPFLNQLASHGKTRLIKQPHTTSSNPWLVPKRWFVHFYMTGLCSLGVVAFLAGCLLNDNDDKGISWQDFMSPILAARILLVVHLGRRTYECLKVQQHRNSQMHILGYALGLGHYLVLPLVFWSIRATDQVTTMRIPQNDDEDLSNLPMLILLMLFNLRMQYEQYRHHCILARMRLDPSKKDDGNENSNTASSHALPPKRRWFRKVLCPHYLAEILLYLSFVILLEWHQQQYIHHLLDLAQHELEIALAAGRSAIGNPQASPLQHFQDSLAENEHYQQMLNAAWNPLWRYRHWMLCVWVTTNLLVSAWNNQQWYAARFPDKVEKKLNFPWITTVDGRKALLP